MSSEKQLSLFEWPNNDNSLASKPDSDSSFSLIPTDVKIPIPSGVYKTMKQITLHCNQCCRCKLGENRTNAVIGRGNPKAEIMIIGEAPGRKEDEPLPSGVASHS